MRTPTQLPTLLLNVPAIAGRSQEEVARILGPPARQEGVDVSQHVKRTYNRGNVEIVFVEGKANWIKLYHTRDLPFAKTAIRKLGLPVTKPTYNNPGTVMSWHTIPRIRELSIYAGKNGQASSVLVCVDLDAHARPKRASKPIKIFGWKLRAGTAA